MADKTGHTVADQLKPDPVERDWELELENGSHATWPGKGGEDAARRYLDAHPEGRKVVAVRLAERHGVFVWNGAPILEPGDGR